MHDHPRLLVVAHGTASPEGAATTVRLVEALRAARPAVKVDLCYLDVAAPTLADALDDSPTVLVPLLLSTGYHVQSDIPALVAGRPQTVVAAHLGPDPLVATVLVDRLESVSPAPAALGLVPAQAATTVVVAAGSSRPEAAEEVNAMAQLLGRALGRSVRVLTMADDLAVELAALPAPVEVATYLLAPGRFVTALRAAAEGLAGVSEPLGVHPALVELVWRRYDEAVNAPAPVN